MNEKEYKYFNYSLLISLIAVFIFPILVVKNGINIKNCNNTINCTSCGITRDFYNIITFKKNNLCINKNSVFIFIIFILNVLFRIYVITNIGLVSIDKSIKSIDVIILILSLSLLFILFNIKF